MTPLDMATCAAVALPCGLAVAACVGWRRALAWQTQLACMRDDADAKRDRMEKDAGRYIGKLAGDLAESEALAKYWRGIATTLEQLLSQIDQSRHLSAKHARSVQLQRRAAIVEAKRLEIEAQLAGELERLVA